MKMQAFGKAVFAKKYDQFANEEGCAEVISHPSQPSLKNVHFTHLYSPALRILRLRLCR
jgi:hypothetical protein